jgi:MoaA/NifB/PqqE/SkfB family radical SAM enzyme
MGVLDALAAGIPTIVTQQGFHLDIKGGVTYPVDNLEDIIRAFNEIAEKRRQLVMSVSTWTWENYAAKHIEIWKDLLDKNKYINLTSANVSNAHRDTSESDHDSDNFRFNARKRILFMIRLLQGSFRSCWFSCIYIRKALVKKMKYFISSNNKAVYFGCFFTILKNKLGIISYPSFVTYLITWRCNAKCIMCDIWKKGSGNELSLREIDDIFGQLRILDVVRISGGEPFVRDDVAEIINIIQNRNRPHIIHITTNGLLKDRILDSFTKIKNPSNIHIKISINAFGKEHDRIMGIDGAFEKAIDTLRSLVEIRDKFKFFVGVNQTIASKESLDGYGKLKEICSSCNVDVFPVLAYANTALYAQEEGLELFPKKEGEFNIFSDFSKMELGDMLRRLIDDSQEIDDFLERAMKRYYLIGAYNRLILGKACPSPKCVVLNNHLRIMPDGGIPICLYNSQIVGNLRQQSFKEIWFGKKIKEYRQKVKNCSICWAGCEIIPNAVYTGDLIKSLFIK